MSFELPTVINVSVNTFIYTTNLTENYSNPKTSSNLIDPLRFLIGIREGPGREMDSLLLILLAFLLSLSEVIHGIIISANSYCQLQIQHINDRPNSNHARTTPTKNLLAHQQTDIENRMIDPMRENNPRSRAEASAEKHLTSPSAMPYIFCVLMRLSRTIFCVYFMPSNLFLAITSLLHPGMLYRIFATSISTTVDKTKNCSSYENFALSVLLEGIFSPILTIALANIYFVYLYIQPDKLMSNSRPALISQDEESSSIINYSSGTTHTQQQHEQLPNANTSELGIDQLYLNSFLISFFLLRMIGFVLGKLSPSMQNAAGNLARTLNAILILIVCVLFCAFTQISAAPQDSNSNWSFMFRSFVHSTQWKHTGCYMVLLIVQPILLRTLNFSSPITQLKSYLLQITCPDTSTSLTLLLWAAAPILEPTMHSSVGLESVIFSYLVITVTQFLISGCILLCTRCSSNYSVQCNLPWLLNHLRVILRGRRCYNVRRETLRAKLEPHHHYYPPTTPVVLTLNAKKDTLSFDLIL